MANERLYQFPTKTSPVPADIVYIGDSANAYNEVQSTIAQIISAYPNLSGIAGLTLGANTFPYSNNSSVITAGTITALAVSLLADSTTATMQTTLGYTATPTALAFAGWDTNKNLSANSFLSGYTTTPTAAATTTLTVASTYQQWFTGTTTQTVVLPVTSTLVLGQQFFIVNNSTGTVTVESSGGNTIQAMAANTTLLVTCILTSGTTAASWGVDYNNTSAISLPLSLSNGGTNAALTASNGGLVYSTGSALAILAGTATAGQIPLSGANAAPTWSTATFASTYAINTLLYASSSNVVQGLATQASSVLCTTQTGAQDWIGPMTNGQLIIGSTGAVPVAAAPTAGNGMSIALAAGALTFTNTGVVTVKLQTFFTHGTSTYTPSTGLVGAYVTNCSAGGGGGGGQGSAGNAGAGGGGGAGAVAIRMYTAAQIGASAALVVGQGGAGGAAGNNNGSAGGTTSFTPAGSGTVLSCTGGAGGTGSAQTTTFTNANGGSGGSPTGGQINIYGNDGGVGFVFNGAGGYCVPGPGGSVEFGCNLANTLLGGISGDPGQGGTGGGGSGTNTAGGNGGDGYISVMEFCNQ